MSDEWTPEQKAVYQRIFTFMSTNKHAFVHPDAPDVSSVHWETTCHNAAWFAVDASAGCGEWTIVDEENSVFASEKAVSLQ